MGLSYNNIYNETLDLINHHKTRDPRQILEERNVHLIAFKKNTKLL